MTSDSQQLQGVVTKSWTDIQRLPDSALLDMWRSSSSELVDPSYFTTTSVRAIAVDTVLKAPALPTELRTVSLIASSTSIPVPPVFRYIPDSDIGDCLVMKQIHGRTLDKCWSDLSWWRRFMVVWTLRGYVNQLRRVPYSRPGHEQPRPGPIGDAADVCRGPFFTEYDAGPFESYGEFADWFDHKLEVSQRMKKAPLNTPQFDRSYPLVLTHLDIIPRNLILDKENRLWVLDWAHAGFYPKYFEYVSMVSDWEELVGRFGGLAARFIAGFYEKQRNWFGNIGWALSTGVFM